MKRALFFTLIICVSACNSGRQSGDSVLPLEAGGPTHCVDPFIGTGGHGHTYPGATMPFGMVQLSPDSRLEGWDGCGGYHYSDSIIYGFSHTHLQGTGVSDYGDILFAPTNSQVRSGQSWKDRYSSSFLHEHEEARPGYYSVFLEDHNLKAELTTTPRVGIHRYSLLGEEDSLTLFIDLQHRDELLEYSCYPQGDSLILGHRISNAWAQEQHVYFAAQFSAPFEWQDQTFEMKPIGEGENGELLQEMEYVPVFPLAFQQDAKEVIIKVGISAVSVQNAYENLYAEAQDWDFDAYVHAADDVWTAQLSKFMIKGGSAEQQRNFYSALYHSNTVPNLFSDANGQYRGTDLEVHQLEGGNHYTIFSLWDTFRATHPQYTLTERERVEEFIQTFLRMYREGGQLPIWELSANYTGCMIGYHSVPVIVDAYFKGINNFDHDLALEAMVQIADSLHLGKPEFADQGFIPSEAEHESVSKGMEYAYDDWCIARFAEALGETETAQRFYQRAQFYQNIVNPESGFAQPRRNGGWADSFDPYEVNFNFTEANSYQYSFFVPQDIEGHIAHVGGPARYEGLLDSLFLASEETTGREQADITGLIGQYAHGNEPSHHMAWLYHYLGKPDKSATLVHRILNELYQDQPDGLCGNEDCGQMSSWYVLSAMGIYPVNPAKPEYLIGIPLFDEVSMQVGPDKTFTIRKKGEGTFIQEVLLNGQPSMKSWIRHQDIVAGGTLEVVMGSEPSKWGVHPENRPESSIEGHSICPTPVISMERVYEDSVQVSMSCPNPDAVIHFEASESRWNENPLFDIRSQMPPVPDDWEPMTSETTEGIFSEPLWLSGQWVFVTAWAELPDGTTSPKVVSQSRKHVSTMDITLVSQYDNQYTGGGDNALIDGINGSTDFRTGEWQGYWGTDVEFILDLREEKDINRVMLRCLQDAKPWIFFPESMDVMISTDGENFTPYGSVECTIPKDDYTPQHTYLKVMKPARTRYVKVIARNMDVIPDWHLGAGGKPWIFVDEIHVN